MDGRRVVVLARHLDGPGGVTRAVTTLANGLAAEGHDVTLLALFRRRPPRHELHPRVRVAYVRSLRPRAIDRLGAGDRALDQEPSVLCDPGEGMTALTDRLLEQHLRSLGPCTLVTHRPPLHQAAAWWAPDHVARLAVEHTSLDAREDYDVEAVTAALPRLDRLVVLTEDSRAQWAAHLAEAGWPGLAARVVVVPNAVPLSGDRHLRSWDAPVVVAAGALLPIKGFDRLVRAWAPLARERPGWTLRIFGNGKERAALDRLVAGLGLEGSVDVAGFTRTLEEEMLAASVYAISSRSEGLPMVMLEAMSVGLPVVGFDASGVRDLVEEGRTGLLVPQGDEAALTAALRRLTGDEDLRRRLGTAGRDRARDYAPPRVVARWERLLADTAR